jgi:hypothetical protein
LFTGDSGLTEAVEGARDVMARVEGRWFGASHHAGMPTTERIAPVG